MHLALGDESWSEFLVDDAYRRIGIRGLVRAVQEEKIRLDS